MGHKSTFTERANLINKISEYADEILHLCSKSDVALSKKMYPLKTDNYHFLELIMSQHSAKDRIYKMLITTLYQASHQSEILSCGAGYINLLFMLNFLKEGIKHNLRHTNYAVKTAAFQKFQLTLQNHTKHITEKELRESIELQCENQAALSTAIWEALNISGLEGRIYVENGKQENYVIEPVDGYEFKVNPFKFMFDSTQEWNKHDCKVMIVDGFVEKVSELEQIFFSHMQTKQPMVILAQGFSEEVAATIKANTDRKLFDIMPIRIAVDLESLNVINDIAIVCDTIPISSLKGDLIACVDYTNIPTVEQFRLTPKKCTIVAPRSRSKVMQHIKALLHLRQEKSLYEDVQKLLDGRIKSLTPGCVKIYLPNMSAMENDAQRVKIDIVLRMCKTLLNYGTIDSSLLIGSEYIPMNPYELAFESTMRKTFSDMNIIPTLSAYVGCLKASQTASMFLESSGIVTVVT